MLLCPQLHSQSSTPTFVCKRHLVGVRSSQTSIPQSRSHPAIAAADPHPPFKNAGSLSQPPEVAHCIARAPARTEHSPSFQTEAVKAVSMSSNLPRSRLSARANDGREDNLSKPSATAFTSVEDQGEQSVKTSHLCKLREFSLDLRPSPNAFLALRNVSRQKRRPRRRASDREQIAPFSRVNFLSPRRSDASQVPSFPPTRHPSTLSPTQEPLKLPHLFFFCFTRPTSYIYIYIYIVYISSSLSQEKATPRRVVSPPLPEPNHQPPPSLPLRPFEHLRGRQRFTMYNARTSSSLVSSAAFSKSPEPGAQRKRMGRGEGGSEGNLSLHAVATWRQEGTVQSTNPPHRQPRTTPTTFRRSKNRRNPSTTPSPTKQPAPSGIVKRASQERGGTKLGVEEKFLV